MTTKKALSVVLTLSLLLGMLAVPGGKASAAEETNEFVLNGGFETLREDGVNLESWSYSLTDPTGLTIPAETPYSVAVDNTEAHSGANSLKIFAPSGTGANWQKIRFTRAFQEITIGQGLQPGAVHELSLWTKTSSSGDRGLWVQSYNAAGGEIDTKNLTVQGAGGGVWQKKTFSFTAPAAAAKIRVSVVAWGSGTYHYDDVSMRVIQTPATSGVTYNSVTLEALSGYEYAIVPGGADVSTTLPEFSAEPAFTGLTEETAYDIYQRIAAAGEEPASVISAKLSVTLPVRYSEEVPILNPDFELVTDGKPNNWAPMGTLPSGAVISVDDTKSRNGSHSLKISNPSADITQSSNQPWVVQNMSSGFVPGKEHEISLFLNGDFTTITGRGAGMKLEFYPGGTGKNISFDASTGENWQQVKDTFLVPEGTTSIRIYVRMFANGVAWFDDVALRAFVEEPAPGGVLAPALLTATDTRISLVPVEGYEYALVSKDAAEPTEFVASPDFDGLTAGTEYDAYQRIAAAGSDPASAVSVKTTVATQLEVSDSIEVPNPGFEILNANGLPVSWTPINGNTVYSIEKNKKKSGLNSLKIDSTGGTAAALVGGPVIGGMQEGAIYDISAYVSTDMNTIGASGAAGITIYYLRGPAVTSENYIAGKHVRISQNTNDQFVLLSESIIAPLETKYIQINFRNFSPGVAYFDDLRLSLGEAPNKYILNTSNVFHYPDQVTGTASVNLTPFYLTGNEAQTAIEADTLADFELRDGETVLHSAANVVMSGGKALYTYPVNVMTEKKKAYQLHVTVSNADGTEELAVYTQNMYVYDRPAMMTPEGDFIVDDEIFNPVLAYHAAPASYAKVKEAGINVVQIGYGSAPMSAVERRESTLAALEEHGLKGLFSLYIDMKPAGHPDNLANTIALVEQYKNDDRIFAWAIMDEPLGAVTMGTPAADERLAWMEASYKAIRDIDPIHPVYMLDYNNLLEGIKYGDVFVADIYALGDDTSSVSTKIAPVTEAVSRVATYELAAIFKQNNRFPTMNTVRNQVYRGFEAGARGTGYYAIDDAIGHDTGDTKTALYDYDAQVWADFVTLNQEEVPLLFDFYVNGADIFNEVRVGDVGRELIWQIWSKNEKMYLMAHNQRTTTQELIIPLGNKDGSIQLGDYTASPIGLTSQTEKTGNGSMTLSLAKEEIALFELVAENPGNENPGNENPGNENPGNENPGNENPGNETPGTGTPGAPADHQKSVVRSGETNLNVDVQVDKERHSATVKLNDDTMNAILKNNKGKKVIVTLPEIEGTISYHTEVPIGNLLEQNNELELQTPVGTLQMSQQMLRELAADHSLDGTITISIGAGERAGIAAATLAMIGERPLVELQISVNGQPLSWNNVEAPVVVTIPYAPTAEERNNHEHLVVWYLSDEGEVVPVTGGRYDPSLGAITFTTTHFSLYGVAYVKKTFGDIATTEWARHAIEVLASKGIINGTSENSYSPDAAIKRADYIMLLVKTLGLADKFEGNFDDVKPTDYYYEAVGAAKQLGIATGVGGNRFNPEGHISREDMMVLTARALAVYKGLSLDAAAGILDGFDDRDAVADYAVTAMATLVREGLIEGTGTSLEAKASTNRAQAAMFLYRVYNQY